MKVVQTLKKHALKIVIAIIVALFIYYVYTNQYLEHLSETKYTKPRVCVTVESVNKNYPAYVTVYAVDSDYESSPKYTLTKVINSKLISNKEKLSFQSGNYGFVVSPTSNEDNTATAIITLSNLVSQVKYLGKKNWLGRRKTSYKCGSTVVSSSLNASAPPTTGTVVASNGLTMTIDLVGDALKKGKNTLYVNSTNKI